MLSFNSWKDYQQFELHVKHQARYVHSDEVSSFLNSLKETLKLRERSLEMGIGLFRSQIGHHEFVSEDGIHIIGHNPERMKPTPEYATEGRANPKGIPYLYLSNDQNTSMMELRPHLGQTISCGEFEVSRNLTVIDCYSVERKFGNLELIFQPPTEQLGIVQAIWSQINDAFAKPVSNSDTASDYVPTQILSELFKSQGYDGICCKSGLGQGHNFILFDMESCAQVHTTVMEVESIVSTFKPLSQIAKVQHNNQSQADA